MKQLESTDLFEAPINSEEASVLLGLNRKTLERMARTHRVPAAKIGRSWLFRRSDLNQWVRELVTSNLAGPQKRA